MEKKLSEATLIKICDNIVLLDRGGLLINENKNIILNYIIDSYSESEIKKIKSFFMEKFQNVRMSGLQFKKLFPGIKLYGKSYIAGTKLDQPWEQKICVGLNKHTNKEFYAYDREFNINGDFMAEWIFPVECVDTSLVLFTKTANFNKEGDDYMCVACDQFIFGEFYKPPLRDDKYYEELLNKTDVRYLLLHKNQLPVKVQNALIDKYASGIKSIYEFKNIILSGEQFNKLVEKTETKLVKLTNDIETHNKYTFKDGLNVDILKFSTVVECSPGGIYFTDVKNIDYWKIGHVYERDVIVPHDAQVYIESNCKIKADKVILGPRRKIVTTS
ncbi:MAG: hypothetical protein Edafosvirus1_117 [Edafosvirus sp.]|uniref:Uncharacterized protein n=1 Tax=Edafosvirus sp. TaxID=2487765 RepID=A0A3G4ZSB1_9VIRU|nr:MAG: hypothetical protein Edafosvirus1_117 [Edafosvirus sp.]